MTNRRDFLYLGLTALALPVVPGVWAAPAEAAVPEASAALPLYKVIFDQRFAESRAYADEMRAAGHFVHGIRGDITDVWFNDLDLRWRKGPAAIAGLTGPGAIFCLERLAWDRRMRVLFRADHRSLPDGRIEHALSGPEHLVNRFSVPPVQGDEWPVRMAQWTNRFPTGPSRRAEETIIRPSLNEGKNPEHLVSWVIGSPQVA